MLHRWYGPSRCGALSAAQGRKLAQGRNLGRAL